MTLVIRYTSWSWTMVPWPIFSWSVQQIIARYCLKAHCKPHVCELKYICTRPSVEQNMFMTLWPRCSSHCLWLCDCSPFDCTPVPQRALSGRKFSSSASSYLPFCHYSLWPSCNRPKGTTCGLGTFTTYEVVLGSYYSLLDASTIWGWQFKQTWRCVGFSLFVLRWQKL